MNGFEGLGAVDWIHIYQAVQLEFDPTAMIHLSLHWQQRNSGT